MLITSLFSLATLWTEFFLSTKIRQMKAGQKLKYITPARTYSISGLKSRVLKLTFSGSKMMVKSGLEFILKLTEPLHSCCCPVQKNLPIRAELALQVSRYL